MTHRHARGLRIFSFRGLSLRGRFALLSALTVSVAIIAAALASYFLVSEQLNNQVNQNVTRMRPLGEGFFDGSLNPYQRCMQQQVQITTSGGPGGGNVGLGPGPGNPFNQQYVLANGKSCATNSDLEVSVSDTQKAIAAGTIEASPEQGVFYDTYSTK